MADTAIDLSEPPSGPPDTVKAHVRMPDGRRAQITRKQKIVCDATVWEGATQLEAARKAGVTTDAVRKAFALPHVQRYLREQRQVFRESARAGNIHRALEIRAQDENRTAAIQAIKYLDGIGDEAGQRESQRAVAPGVVITVNVDRGSAQVDETVIEVNPAGATDIASAGDDQ